MVNPIIDDIHHRNKEKVYVTLVLLIVFIFLFSLFFYGLFAGVDPLLLIVLGIIIILMFIVAAFMIDWAFYERQ
ncbi:MAG: hypothetical protein ABIH52_02890 [Candidatus Aenigmatarchaeota archaeon]